MIFLLPMLFLGGIGLTIAIVFFLFYKYSNIKIDSKISEIESMLPGLNCSECGYESCSLFTKSMFENKSEAYDCPKIGDFTSNKIIKALGKTGDAKRKKTAVVLCQKKDAELKSDYTGIKNCGLADLVHKGPFYCKYACLGFGDCISVCPTGAISIINNVAIIEEAKCISCGKCVEICPKNLIKLVNIRDYIQVACMSKDSARFATRVCKASCIACGKCVEVCQFNAVSIQDNLAVINYTNCTLCGKCVNECPTSAIINFKLRRKS